MSVFQRFSFENLSPERQTELMEKQRKQQIQKDMLEQQIETRRREREAQMQREVRNPEPDEAPQNYQMGGGSPPRGFGGGAQSVIMAQRPSLLSERKVARFERPLVAMSLSPTKIHEAFSSLRHQIMSSAAASILARGAVPNSVGGLRVSTF
jgi:hypothetical protein